jgi:hypothetical protein
MSPNSGFPKEPPKTQINKESPGNSNIEKIEKINKIVLKLEFSQVK